MIHRYSGIRCKIDNLRRNIDNLHFNIDILPNFCGYLEMSYYAMSFHGLLYTFLAQNLHRVCPILLFNLFSASLPDNYSIVSLMKASSTLKFDKICI